jgi:hypothetical protein
MAENENAGVKTIRVEVRTIESPPRAVRVQRSTIETPPRTITIQRSSEAIRLPWMWDRVGAVEEEA